VQKESAALANPKTNSSLQAKISGSATLHIQNFLTLVRSNLFLWISQRAVFLFIYAHSVQFAPIKNPMRDFFY
jgi:hypothetical protein